MISSLDFLECNHALMNVFSRIDMNQIIALVEETPLITNTQKAFYVHMIRERFEKIVKASYDKLMKRG